MKIIEAAFVYAFVIMSLISGMGLAFFVPFASIALAVSAVPIMAVIYFAIRAGLLAEGEHASVLIVEDDLDLANFTSTIFRNLGCETVVIDGSQGAAERISSGRFDLILLDWKLAEGHRADEVLDDSVRLINRSQSLKDQNEARSSKVITYSALSRSDVSVPRSPYFKHWDHWQKPVRYQELNDRAVELLHASGF